jgi:alkylation response protein AidB-like acyl-CoA dehydrogenase
MDFSFTPEQEALRDLTRQILGDRLTHERLRQVEADPDWFDRDAWKALADASLLGAALPEAVGGGGLGLIELCLLLEAVGWTVAPVPAWATLVLGGLPLAHFGTPAQQRRWLPGVAAGTTILSAALVEPDNDDPFRPATVAEADGAGWRLDGTKTCVPAAHLAAQILVPARAKDGVGVFLVDPHGAGVVLDRQVTTAAEPQFQMTLAGARAGDGDVLGEIDAGGRVLGWLVERALVGLCALQTGVTARALKMTAEYTSSREQFGKPLATFQAVAQRAADAYIDVEAIRWTTWQAAWRLAEGLPAADEVAIAKFWAADAGYRVGYAAQHLHGGIGLDLDYPLHRYFLWAKQIELTLGGATRQLVGLGERLAARATGES